MDTRKLRFHVGSLASTQEIFLAWMNRKLADPSQTWTHRLNISWISVHSPALVSSQCTSMCCILLSMLFYHHNLTFKNSLDDGWHLRCLMARKRYALILCLNRLTCSINIPSASLSELRCVMSHRSLTLSNRYQCLQADARRWYQNEDLDFRSRKSWSQRLCCGLINCPRCATKKAERNAKFLCSEYGAMIASWKETLFSQENLDWISRSYGWFDVSQWALSNGWIASLENCQSLSSILFVRSLALRLLDVWLIWRETQGAGLARFRRNFGDNSRITRQCRVWWCSKDIWIMARSIALDHRAPGSMLD
jgi:hypothetical protein